MYMNLKPNKHNRISFNITMASLEFIAPPPLKSSFPPPPNCSGPPPPNYFGLKFLGPSLKLGGAATMKIKFKSKPLIN